MWKSEVWLSSFLCRISYLPPINPTYDDWFCKIYTSYSEIQTLCIWEHLLFCGLIGWYYMLDLTKNNLYLLNGCDLPLKILRLNLEGFSRVFHLTISSQILKGAIHRLKFFARIWEVFQGCFIWEFLPKFFFITVI